MSEPTDPKEAPCKCSQLKAELETEREARIQAQKEFDDLRVWLDGEDRYPVSGPAKFIAEKHRAALAAQTEREDRLEAERDAAVIQEGHLRAELKLAGGLVAGLQAELDAVRKERQEVNKSLETQLETVLFLQGQIQTISKQRDATQARNAELEKLIQDAPHTGECHFAYHPEGWKCTCWKSRLTPPEAKQAISNDSSGAGDASSASSDARVEATGHTGHLGIDPEPIYDASAGSNPACCHHLTCTYPDATKPTGLCGAPVEAHERSLGITWCPRCHQQHCD